MSIDRKVPIALPALIPPVTICVLSYGDHAHLTQRILESLLRHTPAPWMRLRIGLNAVGRATLATVRRLAPQLPVEFMINSERNLYKLPMMRRLLYDAPLTTPWVIWFDDDSYVMRSDWLTILSCESRLQPEVDMWGQALFIRGDEHHRRFIREAPWFRGRELIEDDQAGLSRINFIAGGYWAIRTTCLQDLDWPDRRLQHFGDDYCLGEALRQNDFRMGHARSGVAIDQSARRAPPETLRTEALH